MESEVESLPRRRLRCRAQGSRLRVPTESEGKPTHGNSSESERQKHINGNTGEEGNCYNTHVIMIQTTEQGNCYSTLV